jgi:hypothetical protein
LTLPTSWAAAPADGDIRTEAHARLPQAATSVPSTSGTALARSTNSLGEGVTLPSEDELRVLYDLAMKGEVRRLAALADKIAGREDAAQSFAARLCVLAEDFDEQGILDLLRSAVAQEEQTHTG